MENKFNNEQNGNSIATINQKKEIALPLVAVLLSSPIALVFLVALGWGLPSFAVLFMVLSPIAGLITGIMSLCRGKKRNGVVGMILSIIAIALPASIVILIIVFLIGVSTGLISLM